MSLYKGSQLISGAIPNSANQSLSNLDSAGQDKFDAKVDLDLTNVNDTGKILMSSMGMPSDTYEDLTLGASGTIYTAPANGWVCIRVNTSSTNGFVTLSMQTPFSLENKCISPTASAVSTYLPVYKGSKFTCFYSSLSSTTYFRFHYAVGSESEAS